MLGLIQLFALALLILVVLGTIATVHGMTHPPRLTYGAAIGRGLPANPADIGLRFSEHLLRLTTSTNGKPDETVTWLVQGMAAPSADGSPAPIFVVTHAWGDSRFSAAEYLPLLAKLGSFVLLYDSRGHGDSTARACDVGTTEVDDLLHILAQLPAILPAADRAKHPIILFGASMGGGISIAAAAKSQAQNDGKPIVGVICDGAYRRGMEPIDGHFRRKKYPAALFHYPVGIYLSLRYCSDKQFDRARHAAMLKCPLLMLHGTADNICPFTSAQEIAAAAPKAMLVSFEGAGHLTLLETDPARFESAIKQFLAK